MQTTRWRPVSQSVPLNIGVKCTDRPIVYDFFRSQVRKEINLFIGQAIEGWWICYKVDWKYKISLSKPRFMKPFRGEVFRIHLFLTTLKGGEWLQLLASSEHSFTSLPHNRQCAFLWQLENDQLSAIAGLLLRRSTDGATVPTLVTFTPLFWPASGQGVTFPLLSSRTLRTLKFDPGHVQH
jgi:hypothetical protein